MARYNASKFERIRNSQLDLSLMADVSSRHISFIETGPTSPSRAMILHLADVLDLPHKDSHNPYPALDAGREERLIESYFPADAQCKAFFQQFAE